MWYMETWGWYAPLIQLSCGAASDAARQAGGRDGKQADDHLFPYELAVGRLLGRAAESWPSALKEDGREGILMCWLFDVGRPVEGR